MLPSLHIGSSRNETAVTNVLRNPRQRKQNQHVMTDWQSTSSSGKRHSETFAGEGAAASDLRAKMTVSVAGAAAVPSVRATDFACSAWSGPSNQATPFVSDQPSRVLRAFSGQSLRRLTSFQRIYPIFTSKIRLVIDESSFYGQWKRCRGSRQRGRPLLSSRARQRYSQSTPDIIICTPTSTQDWPNAPFAKLGRFPITSCNDLLRRCGRSTPPPHFVWSPTPAAQGRIRGSPAG